MTMIDLNADVGEGFPFDAQLLRFVSSCNIACGAHAGDLELIQLTVAAAVAHDVAIGAHPGFPDRIHFGRAAVDMPSDVLFDSLCAQIRLVQSVAQTAGSDLAHVKPHGALYNLAASDLATAECVIAAVQATAPSAIVLVLADSLLHQQAQLAGLRVAAEGFIDRAYTSEKMLVPRSHAAAIHHDPQVALAQALALAQSHVFAGLDGASVQVHVDSLCVHGDTPQALRFVELVATLLQQHEITIRPLAQVLAHGH